MSANGHDRRRQVTVSLTGPVGYAGEPMLGVFLAFFTDLHACLRDLDRLVSGDRITARYRIASLGMGSARVTLEAVPLAGMPDHGAEIAAAAVRAVHSLEVEGRCPDGLRWEALANFRKLAEHLDSGLSSIEISGAQGSTAVTTQLRANVDRIMGGRLTAHGSVSGYLEAVNVHRRNTFALYPVVGASRIACHFPPEMLPRVAQGLKRYVTVTGQLRYREGGVFPAEVMVEDLEIHPPAEEAPSLHSLRGLAPQLTDGLNAVEFLRQLRGAHDP